MGNRYPIGVPIFKKKFRKILLYMKLVGSDKQITTWQSIPLNVYQVCRQCHTAEQLCHTLQTACQEETLNMTIWKKSTIQFPYFNST